MAVRTRILEGTWDCTSCGSTKVLGRHKVCPQCGNPREEGQETEFDFGPQTASGASTRESVEDAAALAVANAGEDWKCVFCGASNRGDVQVCRACSAPRDQEPAERAAQPRPVVATPPLEPPRRRWTKPCLVGCALGVLGFVAFILFAIWGGRTSEFTGRVVSRNWSRTIEQQRFTRVTREGWRDSLSERPAVMPVRGAGEAPGVENLRDCSQKQRGTRQVADGTERVCEDKTRRVACGTEEKCTRKTLKNGFAQETCTDVTKYCDESYRDCRNKTRYKDVPVYGTSCRYDTWEWQKVNVFSAQGQDDTPRWPEAQEDALDRLSRAEHYNVVIEFTRKGASRQHTLALTREDEYQSWHPGETVTLVVNNLGTVRDVRHGATTKP
ncbi:MAG: hypothetical protein MUF51_03140 [Vicinamibacteria bacterium]|nr:hypothetical protein [Vicinamibacteria bacterium]